MKKLFLSFLVLSLFIGSCKDDDDNTPSCDTTDVAAVFVGSWNETKISGIGDEVTFSADLSGSCTNESLFSTEVNGDVSNTFTWALNADSSGIILDYPNGLGLEYEVTTVECNEIELNLFGIAVQLTRK